MIEDEAKTKWCPPSWGYSTPSRCVGANCMAWRWSDAKRTAAFLDAVQAHMKSVPNPNFAKSTQVVYAERGREFEQTEGYCGLAGIAQ